MSSPSGKREGFFVHQKNPWSLLVKYISYTTADADSPNVERKGMTALSVTGEDNHNDPH